MTFSQDLVQDPKKIYQLFLLRLITHIESTLYIEHNALSAITPLRGLIASLDDQSKKTLEKEDQELASFEKDVNLVTRPKVEAIYGKVVGYLLKTYLSEVMKGMIPTSILEPTQKKPKQKKYPSVVSEGVQ